MQKMARKMGYFGCVVVRNLKSKVLGKLQLNKVDEEGDNEDDSETNENNNEAENNDIGVEDKFLSKHLWFNS